MKKQTLQLDWQVAKDEREWALLRKPSTPNELSSIQRHQQASRLPEIITVIIFLVAGIVGWWWQLYTNDAQLDQTEAQESDSTNNEVHDQSATNHRRLNEETILALHTTIQNQSAREPNRTLQEEAILALYTAIQSESNLYTNRTPQVAAEIVSLQGNRAVVKVINKTEAGTPLYRQTHFYQQTQTGWVRTDPDASLWGDERRLETPSFIFHLRENDLPTVLVIAAQTEELYITLRQTLGLPLTHDGTKLVIEIRVTELFPRLDGAGRIVVASPLLYQAPVELSNEELLLQSIALPLTNHILWQMRTQTEILPRWEPLFRGLNLWLLWEQGLPLAAWKEPVIEWVYTDIPAGGTNAGVILPVMYEELCTVHGLWLSSPAQIGIPIMCDPAGEAWFRNLWGIRDPLVRLHQFNFPGDFDHYIEPMQRSSQPVAAATLIDYVVTAYGREQLPGLLASLKTADSWEMLINDVYGISVAEFEAGWQVHLKMYADPG